MPQIGGAAQKAGYAAGLNLLGKLSSLWQQLEFVHSSAQLCERREPHLPHHIAAMYLHRTLAYAHIAGDLLVQPALCNLSQYAELTRGQGLDSCPKSTNRFILLAPGTIACEPEVDCVKKLLVAEWLREKLDSTPFHRLHTHWNVAVPSDENNRKLGVGCNQIALEIQPALPRHSDVEDQAGWTIRRLGAEILCNRGK